MAKPFKGTINVDLLPGQGLLAHRLVPQPFPELDFTKGQDPGEPITQDYPGEPPYRFRRRRHRQGRDRRQRRA